mgnify:CR=1 FL=1
MRAVPPQLITAHSTRSSATWLVNPSTASPPDSSAILAATGISTETKARDLTDDEVLRIRDFIDKNYIVEGDLRREVRQNIGRLIEINCYRGQRHRRNLPVRGQRTKTNARQKRGARRTVAGKKRAGKK